LRAGAWLLRPLWRALRFFSLWLLPPLVLALVLALGFAWWCFASQDGSRWLLRTVAGQLDGRVQGVQGSLARGLSVQGLSLAVSGTRVEAEGLHLQVRWPELRDGRLHVEDVSVVRMRVRVRTPPARPPSGAPFRLPALPVAVRVDRLALGTLDVEIDGRPLPVEVRSLASAMSLDAQGATLWLDQLQLVRDDAQVTLDGNARVRGLAAPWPFEVNLQAHAQGTRADSPLCLRQFVGRGPAGAVGAACDLRLQARAAGTLDALHVQASGEGEGLRLEADADVRPGQAFPLGETHVDLGLPGGASLRVAVTPGTPVETTQVSLKARVPKLAALWPGLPGDGTLSLEAGGSLARHQAELKLHYVPRDAREGVPGRAPLTLDLAADGGWEAASGWRGRVTKLQARHAGLAVHSLAAIPVSVDPAGAWQVGQAALDVALDGQPLLRLLQQAASGSPGQWALRGSIPSLVVTPARILDVERWLGRAGAPSGGVRTVLSDQVRRSRLEARLDWDLKFKDALSGDVRLARTDGDLTVPGAVPITLGLRAASLDLALRPTGGGTSVARADLRIQTAKMGSLRVLADTPVHATPGGGIAVRPRDVKHVRVQADSDDLAWVNLLLDESLEIGGTVHADVQGQSRADGRWTFSGPVSGRDLSILSVDQGVRLLQGTLQAHLDGGRLVLDHLRFPAVRRVTPKEWRTATWISENPDAQNGALDVSGDWDLSREQGQVRIAFRRYPILQRSDRYAMVSGDVAIEATLPAIRVDGKITADAGWFDLDMLNNIPSLDSDVVILRPGQAPAPAPSAPLDLSADLTLDLGPRFYLTGYGVNSGLVGSLNLRMRGDKLTALGALRTRGGSIDVYGQHLQLRHGTVTFQGDLTNPVISIEALRTDTAVQAGVRVAGTARRPRIDLVSHPDVSETEKLTWLILGHGPDEGGGGDVSLLFSVGSSFLSGGEPFYKKFGLDELSMRSGELGSTGSVLPAQSVVTDLDTGASPAEQRFVVASKTLTDKLRVSLEQALAQTGTVARLSYRILRRLQAEATVGTVNGLALVYRWFSMD
jgi:translocation and assembly module TamB